MMKQAEIVAAIATELTGAPGIGEVIGGALAEIDSAVSSSSSATVAIEYGETEPLDQVNQRRTATLADSRFSLYVDIYWSGPPAVWEARIFDDAYPEVWRRIMDDFTFGGSVSGVLRIQPAGHDEPELNTEGDRQHVSVRTKWLVDFRNSLLNPEA